MRAWILAAALGTAALGSAGLAARAGGGAEEIEPYGPRFGRFLFFATMEGACEDGIPEAAVKAALEQDAKGNYVHFVYACPICSPVLEGLRAYSMREQFYYSRKGDPLTPEAPPPPVAALAAPLVGKDRRDRGAALASLVDRWVKARMDRLRLTGEERTAWRRAMEHGRKKGMGRLEDSDGFEHKSCPSCDGANGSPFEIPK